jgi:hypothetical protein
MTECRFAKIPPNMASLPIDARGFPIPWFVYIDAQGHEDFRVIGPRRIYHAVRDRLCWICGKRLHTVKAFTIGPMCAINRTTAEPPAHLECAVFAAKNCPFLSQPLAKRNDRALPEGHLPAPGTPILRNPGVTLVWLCDRFKPFYPPGGGVLFNIGKPRRCHWFAHGREATQDEVLESIRTGFPILEAEAEKDGPDAVNELRIRTLEALRLLPKAA